MKTFDLRKFLSENKLTPTSKIIKEEANRYDGKLPKILSLISNLKSKITNRPPKTYVKDGLLFVSAEDGNYFADYYPEMSDDPFIDPRLEKIADRYDTYWEWEDAGSIVLAPLNDLDENITESRLDVSQVDMGSLELDGFSQEDPTDLADVYIVSAQFLDGRELTDDELEQLQDQIPDVIYDKALERMSMGAEDAWDARYDESKGKKNFNLKKFLAENKLTIDSRNLNEMNLYNLSDLPSDVEWQEGGVADTGTDNPLGSELGERESYDVQVFGYSPSTGKSYEGLAGGSYGETDFDNIDNIEEIPNERNPYYPGKKSNMGEASLADYADKWYESLLGLENLHKYPQDFIDWLNEEDTWAESYAMKYKIKNIIDLFSVWVNEKY
jgi:hypothetical protein